MGIAQSLGRLAASLEKSGHSAEAVATFLMRALFTMFAEDVELLPKDRQSLYGIMGVGTTDLSLHVFVGSPPSSSPWTPWQLLGTSIKPEHRTLSKVMANLWEYGKST